MAIKTKELLPVNLQGDKNIDAICEAADRVFLFENELNKLLIYPRIDELIEPALNFLGWQFHVEGFELTANIEEKRDIIKHAIELHRYKGTPWAIKSLLSTAGFSDTEIIEYHQARKLYIEKGGKRIDGSWQIDGTSKLIPYYDIVGLPYMWHWAQFVVRINIANAKKPNFDRDIRNNIEYTKNVRSWPVWLWWLAILIQIYPQSTYTFLLDKYINQQYPWDVNRLDGSWRVGLDDRLIRIGEFRLDGNKRLSEVIKGVVYKTLYNGIIEVTKTLYKESEADYFLYVNLGESKARLDGSWRVGRNHIISFSDAYLNKKIDMIGSTGLDIADMQSFTIAYPASPHRIRTIYKLDGSWRVNGAWKIDTPTMPLKIGAFDIAKERPFEAVAEQNMYKSCSCGILKRLTKYRQLGIYHVIRRLDATWQISAYHRLDGSWQIDGRIRLSAPAIGIETDKIDGSWKIGPIRDIRLDGSWRVGDAQGAYIDIDIKRAA